MLSRNQQLLPARLLERVLAQRERLSRRVRSLAEAEGKLVFDGALLTPAEVEARSRELRRSELRTALKLSFLFASLLSAAAFFLFVLYRLCY